MHREVEKLAQGHSVPWQWGWNLYQAGCPETPSS